MGHNASLSSGQPQTMMPPSAAQGGPNMMMPQGGPQMGGQYMQQPMNPMMGNQMMMGGGGMMPQQMMPQQHPTIQQVPPNIQNIASTGQYNEYMGQTMSGQTLQGIGSPGMPMVSATGGNDHGLDLTVLAKMAKDPTTSGESNIKQMQDMGGSLGSLAKAISSDSNNEESGGGMRDISDKLGRLEKAILKEASAEDDLMKRIGDIENKIGK